MRIRDSGWIHETYSALKKRKNLKSWVTSERVYFAGNWKNVEKCLKTGKMSENLLTFIFIEVLSKWWKYNIIYWRFRDFSSFQQGTPRWFWDCFASLDFIAALKWAAFFSNSALCWYPIWLTRSLINQQSLEKILKLCTLKGSKYLFVDCESQRVRGSAPGVTLLKLMTAMCN